MQRIDKYLCDHNIGTRRQIKEYIKNGMVRVNGRVIVKADSHIDEAADVIEFNSVRLVYSNNHYFMLNKPAGVVCTAAGGMQQTVCGLFSGEGIKGLSTAGRLDIDTEGIILVTDDGMMIHNTISPSHHVDKVYEVHLEKAVSNSELLQIEQGVDIGDEKLTLPSTALRAENDSNGKPVILLTIHEGRFHQVKRMFEVIGNKVIFLKRISFGPLRLDEKLAPGEYRKLTIAEIKLLTDGTCCSSDST